MLDTGRMLAAAAALPEELIEALRRAEEVVAPTGPDITDIVVTGVGQDASVGDMLAAVGASMLPVPVVVVAGSGLPLFVGPHGLVLAVSGAGDAPETAWAVRSALDRGARVVAVAGPGELADLAGRSGLPLHRLEPGAGARDALAAVLVPLLVTCEQLGLLHGARGEIVSAAAGLARRRDALVARDGGAARSVARRIGRTFPFVHGAEGIGAVAARRWADQCNMGAKAPAFAGAEPHRSAATIAGYGQHGDVTRQLITLVELRNDFEGPGMDLRFALAERHAAEAVAAIVEIRAEGAGPLAQLLDLVLVGDFVALHLAAAEGLDPGPVPVVDDIARRVAAAGLAEPGADAGPRGATPRRPAAR